jgi:hypothetical protein
MHEHLASRRSVLAGGLAAGAAIAAPNVYRCGRERHGRLGGRGHGLDGRLRRELGYA